MQKHKLYSYYLLQDVHYAKDNTEHEHTQRKLMKYWKFGREEKEKQANGEEKTVTT